MSMKTLRLDGLVVAAEVAGNPNARRYCYCMAGRTIAESMTQ